MEDFIYIEDGTLCQVIFNPSGDYIKGGIVEYRIKNYYVPREVHPKRISRSRELNRVIVIDRNNQKPRGFLKR